MYKVSVAFFFLTRINILKYNIDPLNIPGKTGLFPDTRDFFK